MGLRLSGVLACLSWGILESGLFQRIFRKQSLYFRYINDALLIQIKIHRHCEETKESGTYDRMYLGNRNMHYIPSISCSPVQLIA